jgi:glycosyltransferase involved in cell wall biosynthesis
VKLVVQIPCWNEADCLAETLAAIPRAIEGISSIEVLVIDDGSTDSTVEVARHHGAHRILRLSQHRGLADAFSAGIDVALRLGADIIVNTDADHQYPGSEIPRLIQPILERRADLVIGNRQTDTMLEFSAGKRWAQRWGSRFLRSLSGADVTDSPSGFRAMSRACALRLFVHNRFTYTLETVILAGQQGLGIVNVPIRTNAARRPSRLFRSVPEYITRAGPVLLRAYAMYQPLRVVGLLVSILGCVGVVTALRFLYHYVRNPNYSGYVQSLVLGSAAFIVAVLLAVAALLAELIASNRRLLEDLRARVVRVELTRDHSVGDLEQLGVTTTGTGVWLPVTAGEDTNAGATSGGAAASRGATSGQKDACHKAGAAAASGAEASPQPLQPKSSG